MQPVSRRQVLTGGFYYGGALLLAGCGGGGGGTQAEFASVVTGGAYTLVDIGPGFVPSGINNRGQVALNRRTEPLGSPEAGWNQVWLWTANPTGNGGTLRDTTPPDYNSPARYLQVSGINEAGQTIGRVVQSASSASEEPFTRAPVENATLPPLTLLPTEPNYGGSEQTPGDISDTGIIVGTRGDFNAEPAVPGISSASAPFYVYRDGQQTAIRLPANFGSFFPGNYSTAYARGVNNAGMVVGYVHSHFRAAPDANGILITLNPAIYAHEYKAFMFRNGTPVDLGIPYSYQQSFAFRINNAGQVIGAARRIEYVEPGVYSLSVTLAREREGRAFLWQDRWVYLGTLPGYAGSTPRGINDSGVVVGCAYNSGNVVNVDNPGQDTVEAERAFVWQNGRLSDLNTLIAPDSPWVLQDAHDINNEGWIAVSGTFNGGPRAAVLIPARS